MQKDVVQSHVYFIIYRPVGMGKLTWIQEWVCDEFKGLYYHRGLGDGTVVI